MPDLSGLSRVDLYKAEASCDFLLQLHRDHDLMGGELAAGLGTLLTSVRTILQERARQRPRQAPGRADTAQAAPMTGPAAAQLPRTPRAAAVNTAVSSRVLAAVLAGPAAALTGEQANVVIQLAVALVSGDPLAVAALEMTGAMLDACRAPGPPPGCLTVTGLDEVTGRELAARRARLLSLTGAAGPDTCLPAALAAAVALTAVTAEQDRRTRAYAAHPDSPYQCACGFCCRGLAAIDDHLDQAPAGSGTHYELCQADPAAAPPET